MGLFLRQSVILLAYLKKNEERPSPECKFSV